MSRLTAVLLVAGLAVLSASAQEPAAPAFSYQHFIPKVAIYDRAVSLQVAVLPDVYGERSVAADMDWVTANDRQLVSFWEASGDTVLHVLCELSGIEWVETEFDIYVVRLFPTTGSSNPLVIPIGGIHRGSVSKAVPRDNRLVLDLVFQLARRMLEQTVRPQASVYNPIADHPLMQSGPYRRDNLALLLALAACERVIGPDSTSAAYQSLFWKQNFPGWEVFDLYFREQWALSPARTLAALLAQEPYDSKLVNMTRSPEPPNKRRSSQPRAFVEDLPLAGSFGFSIRTTGSRQLEVYKIDTARLAWVCGLRQGDVIRRVNGQTVRSQKDMIERIYDTFESGGATLEISRAGGIVAVIIHPLETLPSPDTAAATDSSGASSDNGDSTLYPDIRR
jgi:hypothetical protein